MLWNELISSRKQQVHIQWAALVTFSSEKTLLEPVPVHPLEPEHEGQIQKQPSLAGCLTVHFLISPL